MNGKHSKDLPTLESYVNGKSNNWILHEELFGAKLYAEPWSPSKADFDQLIDEQDCFEISLRRERRKTEELKKENSQLKKDVKTLKNSNMKLEGDLRAVKTKQHEVLVEDDKKDEIIADLESRNKLLEKELTELKSSRGKIKTSQMEINISTQNTFPEINNNNPAQIVVSREPAVSEISTAKKTKKRLSNVSLLVKEFESRQNQASEQNEVKRTPVRRKTVHAFYPTV